MNKNNKILLIDDEPNILKSYQRTLRNQSYDIICAQNGSDAITAIIEHSFQVVISDFRMPGANGLEILKKVQEYDPKIIRVILSGYADEAAVEYALKIGSIDKYLLKPIDNKRIREEIEVCFLLYDSQLGRVITKDG